MITRLKLSTIEQGLPKYRSMLAGNDAYIPTSFESIATITPSGVSTITFSSIPSTYQHLQIRIGAVTASTSYPSLAIQFNGDTSASYITHTLRGNGTTATAAGSTGRTSLPLAWLQGMVVTYQNVAILDIHDYTSTTKNKTTRAIYGQENNSGTTTSTLELMSGLWTNTSAISSITIAVSGGGPTYAAGTSIALYGIK